MKNGKSWFICLAALLSATYSPAFAAAQEKSDSVQTSPAPKSAGNASGIDSVKDVAPKNNEKKCDHEEPPHCFRFDNPGKALQTVNALVDTLTRRGWGGGGGPMIGMFAINIKPFIDLTATVYPLRSSRFSFGSLNYKAFFMSGGMGFLGIGNGLRLGGGGMSGVRHFTGKNATRDSAVNLKAQISWGGFLIEKLIEKEKYSLIVGGYLGSGSMKADWVKVDDGYSVFGDYNDRFNSDDSAKVTASFGYFEMHAGLVYHFMRFIHIGGDISLPILVSADGFAPFTREFFSVCPGVRVRLIFGNLG